MPSPAQTAFYEAIVNKNEEAALSALERFEGEDINFLVKLPSGFLLNCIHVVAQYGLLQVLNKMIEKGADLSLKDGHGQTAMHLAQGNGHRALISCLFKCQPALCILGNTGGITPFHLAVKQGDLESVCLFLKHKSDLNQVKDHQDDTLLHWAARHNQRLAAQKLLAYGARATVLNKNNFKPSDLCPMIGGDPELEALLKAREDSLFERCAVVVDTLPEQQIDLPELLLAQQQKVVDVLRRTQEKQAKNQTQLDEQFTQMQIALERLKITH
ncbi:MAG: ankyrin repeat domain-containing protein [Proteobacteria bacterium]|nr:ankyrin repeat domain-containing protein [Pseudomonadota bacterium]